jgi:hypothetical protein
MTVNDTVRQKVADWRPTEGRGVLTVPDAGGWSVAVTADCRDEVGCLVWEVSLRYAGAPAGRADADLAAWAGRIASQATGLLEPLKVVEVDPERREALLRSDPPAAQGDRVTYYELMLQGTAAATLRRFEAARRGPGRREQVAFALTDEAIAKLVAVVAGVV